MGEILGMGTKFYREGTTPDTFEVIAGVSNISPPQPQRNIVEIEELDPPGEVKRKIAGLIDAGEVQLTLNFLPEDPGQTALEQDFKDAKVINYRIKLPNDYGWTFSAICTAYQPQELEAEGVVQVVTIFALTGVYDFGKITTGA